MSMSHRPAVWMFLACCCLLAAGCASTPARWGDSKSSGPTEKEMERRARAHAHYAQGVLHELNGDASAALDSLETAARLDPRNEELALDVSLKLLKRREGARAVELLEEAARQPKASAELVARLGLAYAQADRAADAARANQRALKIDPAEFSAYQNLYLLEVQAGRTNKARAVLEKATAVKPAPPEFLIDLAELFTRHGNSLPDEKEQSRAAALQLLERAAQLEPAGAHLRLKLAEGLTLLGESKRAAEIYEQLIQRYEDMPLMRDNLRARLTSIYLQNDNRDRAMSQLESLIEDDPANAGACLQLAALAYEAGDFKKAEDYYRRALVLREDFEPVYYELANVLLNLDKPEQAISLLDRAGKRFDKRFIGEYLTAIALHRQEKYEQAIERFTTAEVLARAGEPARLTHFFYFQFGAASERNGDIVLAEAHFEKALELSPDFAEAMNYLGYMWADRGENLERAHELIERAVELEPENEAYLDSLGWVLFKQGKVDEALEHLQRAVDLAEEPDATILDHLGDAHAALGQMDDAREAWRQSLAVEENEQVRKKLESPDQP